MDKSAQGSHRPIATSEAWVPRLANMCWDLYLSNQSVMAQLIAIKAEEHAYCSTVASIEGAFSRNFGGGGGLRLPG